MTPEFKNFNRPLNLLISSPVHWWNAEAAYAATLAELLQKAGHRVFVLTRAGSRNAQKLQELGIPLVTHIELHRLAPWKIIQAYFRLKRFLLQEKIELVNVHRSEGFIFYALLKWSLGTFKLVRTRGTVRPIRSFWLNRLLYGRWTEAHIAAGQAVAQHLEALGIAPERLQIIYYPAPVCSPPSSSLNYYHEFQVPPSAKTLGIVGRLSPIKGHRLLLESFREVLKVYPQTFLIVCYKEPDPQRADLLGLKQYVADLGLEEHVRFIGPRVDIQHLMRWLDVGVVSSLGSEVICRVAVEFFSVGTPVVAFPTGCLPELIQTKKNGILAQEHSMPALRDSILALLEDTTLLEKLGAEAQHQAQTQFSPEFFLQQTLSVFAQALSQKAACPETRKKH